MDDVKKEPIPPNSRDAEMMMLGCIQQSQKSHNAIQICLAEGAGIGPIKSEIKAFGCWFNEATKKYSCPIDAQDQLKTLFESKEIKATLKPITDLHFEKSEIGKKADNLYTSIGIKEEWLQQERNQLCIDEELLEKEINARGLPEDNSYVIKKRKFFDDRKDNLKSYVEEIKNLRSQANLYENSEKEIIQIIPGDLPVTADKAELILSKSNAGIYQRSGRLCRIIKEKTKPEKKGPKDSSIKRPEDALTIDLIDSTYLTDVLGRISKWEAYCLRSKEWKRKDCPKKVSEMLLSRREWGGIKVLAGVIRAPTLRQDGSILEDAGYDENTGLFLDTNGQQFPRIPQNPSRKDAIIAKEKLLDLLKGFPFVNDESKSVVLSAILTALVRKSLRSAPLHGFSAPKMGTGKSLLADVVGLTATGHDNCVLSQASDETEEKKRLLAVLAEGDAVICFDNIERPFGSAALCSILTQTHYKDRLLGSTKNLTVLTDATFLATGNNLTFIGDLSTRAILCRIDPRCERPEERDFDIDLRKYIPENRGELVQAALTILRAYHCTGRPRQNIPQFCRFEEWSNWVRSALVWVGMEDPCTSRKEIENNDLVRVALGNLLSAWFAVFDNMAIKVKFLIDHENELLQESLREFSPPKNGNISDVSLGVKLNSYNERIENGYQLEKIPNSTGHKGSATWRVKKIKEEQN